MSCDVNVVSLTCPVAQRLCSWDRCPTRGCTAMWTSMKRWEGLHACHNCDGRTEGRGRRDRYSSVVWMFDYRSEFAGFNPSLYCILLRSVCWMKTLFFSKTETTMVWQDLSSCDCVCFQATECKGIKIFHSNSSIYFANSDLYVNALKRKVNYMCKRVCYIHMFVINRKGLVHLWSANVWL